MTRPGSPDDQPANQADQPADETAYLLQSPANARRLIESIQQLESGGGEHHDLLLD